MNTLQSHTFVSGIHGSKFPVAAFSSFRNTSQVPVICQVNSNDIYCTFMQSVYPDN